ncbi:hypothetical protein KP509_34G030700 [Ceratopteris richardii]|nr:hypothetical protein KP509_34G030700 [Ceratopteris richardii]
MRALPPSSHRHPSHQEALQPIRGPIEDESSFFAPGAASLRGRRSYQEDRLLCSPGISAYSSAYGNVDLFGVFDGHLGDEASDFVSRSLTERFLHHSSSPFTGFDNTSMEDLQLFRASLSSAISDIDAAFGNVARARDIKSGSTACIALRVEDQIIVANVGDSRAFLCSSCLRGRDGNEKKNDAHNSVLRRNAVRSRRKSKNQVSKRCEDSPFESGYEGFCVTPLSSDHRPDRPDEKLRIEASGGFVTNSSLPRVNGKLAVSRSIGDIDFRRFGVISEPEFSDWHRISRNDKFLVLASDGVFEKMSAELVCNVLHALEAGLDLASIMELLEVNNNVAIALPGANSPDVASIEGAGSHLAQHVLEGSCESEKTYPPSISSRHACQGEDNVLMNVTPTFGCSLGYAHILARIIVELAFHSGSMDNLSALVIPLKV